ncbi:TPA: FecR family protein [Pseudomonas putida]
MTSKRSTERPQSAEDDALARHREALRAHFPLPEPKPRKASKTRVISALAVILAAGVIWLDPAYRHEQHVSAVGERQMVELADGSRVQLDSDTRLDVSWHLRSRRVELSTGQALFDVSKAWLRPFRVEAGDARISVLGTQFNVLRQDGGARVALLRGSVDIYSSQLPAQQVRLKPGEQVDVRQGRLQPVSRADVETVLAWRERRLVFARTPLGEVLAHVQRYRQGRIELQDPSLAELPITGVFDADKADELLDLLPRILPLSLARAADGSVSITRRAAKR